MTLHKGSCHCGKVVIEVETDIDQVIECNCSICRRKGYLLAFVPRAAMKLVQGEDSLTTYQFNTHNIRHRFCATCGCAPFGEGTAPNGDAMASINVRCLETVDLADVKRVPFNGRDR
jgi:hypothetical protein